MNNKNLMSETLTTLDSFIKPLTALVDILDYYEISISSIFNSEEPTDSVPSAKVHISSFRLLSSLFMDALQMAISVVDVSNIEQLMNYFNEHREFFNRILTSDSNICVSIRCEIMKERFKKKNIYKVFDLLNTLTNLNIDYRLIGCVNLKCLNVL